MSLESQCHNSLQEFEVYCIANCTKAVWRSVEYFTCTELCQRDSGGLLPRAVNCDVVHSACQHLFCLKLLGFSRFCLTVEKHHSTAQIPRDLNMSWMDSWSRPSKHAVVPPPLYLLPGGEATPYCHSCGRVISSRKVQTSKAKTPVKYCSDRCRHHKPGSLDRQIEDTFVVLLNGSTPAIPVQPLDASIPESNIQEISEIQKIPQQKRAKGDPRLIISFSTVEALVFGSRNDPNKVYGRKKNRAPRGIADKGEWRSVDMEDRTSATDPENEDSSDESAQSDISLQDSIPFGAGKVRPPQSKSDVNGSVGGEKGWAERAEETAAAIEKRKEGQKWAERREMVKSAARRGVVFGFLVQGNIDRDGEMKAVHKKGKKKALEEDERKAADQTERRRKCEAIMNDAVVEPSFAKGEWGIRWRE